MNALRAVLGAVSEPEVRSIVDLFHRLSRVLPENQIVEKIGPTTTVSEALHTMKRLGYSQLPVVEGTAVLGIFSFRSLAEGVLHLRKLKPEIGDLTVDEFVQKPAFARVTDEFKSIFDALDRDGAVLVGEPESLQGIVTAVDVLRYLYGIASPFVLITEIELTLRALISFSMDEAILAECTRIALAQKYSPDKIPSSLNAMVFGDYVHLIGHSENWKHFSAAFGGMREIVRTKLEDIRVLRNDIFHFKRELTWEDHEKLAQYRDWILMRARRCDALKRGSHQ